MNASLLPAKLLVECCWSYRSLTFAYFKPFLGLKCTAGLDWSKKFFKPMNMDFAFKALQIIAIFRYGRFEFEAVSDKWLHETSEEEGDCRKPRKRAPTRQQPVKKGRISESSTCCIAFGESVLGSLSQNYFRCRQNKAAQVYCHSVPVL